MLREDLIVHRFVNGPAALLISAVLPLFGTTTLGASIIAACKSVLGSVGLLVANPVAQQVVNPESASTWWTVTKTVLTVLSKPAAMSAARGAASQLAENAGIANPLSPAGVESLVANTGRPL